MSNRNKGEFSWRAALGRGTGGALGSGAAGAAMGSLGGPAGPIIGGAIGAGGGFVGGVVGYILGYYWDAPPEFPEQFGSAALYTTVVCGFLAALFDFLAWGRLYANPPCVEGAVFAISALPAFLASMSRSLIDDMRAASESKMYQ